MPVDAWVESHQALRDHPKVVKLSRQLGIGRRDAVGLLHYLWWWALDHAEDGDITEYDADDMAAAVDWEGDAELLVKALLGCGPGTKPGFLEQCGDRVVLHDWWNYAGKLVAKRRSDRERQRANRAASPADPMDVHRTSQDRPSTSQVTEPNRTNNHPSSADADGVSVEQDFDPWWFSYPRKVGRAAALVAYRKARKVASAEDITGGLDRSKAQWQREDRPPDKIPHATTWLNQRRWEDDYQANGRPKAVEDAPWS